MDGTRSLAPTGGVGRRLASLAAVVVAMVVALELLMPWWTAVEAELVRWALSPSSVGVRRSGNQLLIDGDGGGFVLLVTAWCSSLGPLLAAIAAVVVVPRRTGRLRRRAVRVMIAAGVLVLGNTVRMAAIAWYGASVDLGRVDAFHDGPAMWLSVGVVLAAAAVVAWRPRPASSVTCAG
ncbi:MAG: archaeosortase/exosortase family protein [Acidimicrobiales bacterium]|nr:archaeosortase/exosortase family protein [Acidimicrobiales bacterium]MCB9394378.1 archaeosortase/exosortase family protein [Acidimicrobiaceae bacterium]